MQEKQAILTDFRIQRPKFETTQERTLEWLYNAHVQAEKTKGNMPESELTVFKEKLKEKLYHVGCKPHQVGKRGHEIDDYLYDDYEKMPIYSLHTHPSGKSLTTRTKKYKEVADKVFEKFYENETNHPDDLIHVTCTGYASPSGAQELISLKNWDTTITHAYHMGCYGAIAAIRMARGFFHAGQKKDHRVDIVHTEICSLHTNPSLHEPDQLVSQSLFADGHVHYKLIDKKNANSPYLEIITIKEHVVPNSSSKMSWMVYDWGFQLYISRDIPVLIAKNLKGYLEMLCKKANLSIDILTQALYAIHPGGPKILDHIKALLGLTDQQIKYSYDILYEYGNMSSATVPHIWHRILEKEKTNPYIISLAFGPGLSICGSILKKEG